MTSRSLGFAATALILLMTTATARAEEEAAAAAYNSDSAYASVGLAYAIEQNDSALGSGIPVRSGNADYGDLTNSWGYDLRVGYSFRKMFAAEIQWQSLVNFDTDAINPYLSTPTKEPSVEARMLSVNGRFSPLAGRIQPYALVGMGWYNVQADKQAVSIHESSFALRFGLGVAAFITDRLGVAFESGYILPTSGSIAGGNSFDLIPFTLSAFFKFK